jgi:hypothetical protein
MRAATCDNRDRLAVAGDRDLGASLGPCDQSGQMGLSFSKRDCFVYDQKIGHMPADVKPKPPLLGGI